MSWRDARLAMMTEAGVAEWLASDGVRVVEHRGRHWQEVVPGFFQPVHYLARFDADSARRSAPPLLGQAGGAGRP